MRLTLASLMLFAVLPLLRPGEPLKHQSAHANSDKQKATQDKPPAAPATVTHSIAAENSKDFGQTKTNKTEPENVSISALPKINIQKTTSDYAYVWASVLIAILTLGIAAIALIQATAAKKSANALMSSERAWIQAGPDMPEFQIKNLADPSAIAVFYWSVNNAGRTPARLLEIAARYRLIKDLNRISKEPEWNGDLEKIPLYEKLLIPNERFWSFQPLEPSVLSPDDIIAISGGRRILFAYGYVNYFDVFGERHETNFCWYYLVPQGGMVSFRKEGWIPYLQAPPAYKKVT